jgi:hypothetical protein
MILVRMVFQAKPRKGGELAQAMAASLRRAPANGQQGLRVLTDLSGPFDTVVIEMVLESLAAWEQGRAAMFADPGFQASAASSNDLMVSGQHEFYTIEAAN